MFLKKYVVLLSAGLDSSTNLYAAHREGKVLLALSFDYGQRAAIKEIPKAQDLAQKLEIPHQTVSLPWMGQFSGSALLNTEKNVPTGSDISIDDFEISNRTAKAVWVPNRNGIFLNIAAGFAENLGADFIVPGFNKEEAATFSDNSEDFMKVLDQSFSFSTANKVKVACFTQGMDKTEIVGFAKKLGLDFKMLWPCYLAGDEWCGKCESCQRSLRAMVAQGVIV